MCKNYYHISTTTLIGIFNPIKTYCALTFRVKFFYKKTFSPFQDNFAHPTVNWGPIVNDQRCGISAVRRNVAQRRIVGGDEAGFGTFPWQAYIRQEDNGKKDYKNKICVT